MARFWVASESRSLFPCFPGALFPARDNWLPSHYLLSIAATFTKHISIITARELGPLTPHCTGIQGYLYARAVLGSLTAACRSECICSPYTPYQLPILYSLYFPISPYSIPPYSYSATVQHHHQLQMAAAQRSRRPDACAAQAQRYRVHTIAYYNLVDRYRIL